ncbi:MAG: methyltransferase domain-containing protein, partial [Polyangiaceae bacterium]|nr:methyltransferase domain-containing protein [Polyangiaceae bacterium]
MVPLDTLAALFESDQSRDRAFADGLIRMHFARATDASERREIAALFTRLRDAALRAHADLRASIAAGSMRGAVLRARFDEVPAAERDHFVEEVLGIAYPPLDERRLGPELVAYQPSGYDEIVQALDVTNIDAGGRFLDIGSGMGKAVLLAALLTGASSSGLELDAELHEIAKAQSEALGLERVQFRRGDAREETLDEADVIFMYLPFTGEALATVMTRLLTNARVWTARPAGRFLCGGALDLVRYPELEVA